MDGHIISSSVGEIRNTPRCDTQLLPPDLPMPTFRTTLMVRLADPPRRTPYTVTMCYASPRTWSLHDYAYLNNLPMAFSYHDNCIAAQRVMLAMLLHHCRREGL